MLGRPNTRLSAETAFFTGAQLSIDPSLVGLYGGVWEPPQRVRMKPLRWGRPAMCSARRLIRESLELLPGAAQVIISQYEKAQAVRMYRHCELGGAFDGSLGLCSSEARDLTLQGSAESGMTDIGGSVP